MKSRIISPIIQAVVFFTLLFGFISTSSQAQLAKTLQYGVPGKAYASCADNTNLYVLYSTISDSNTFSIAKWNGAFWCSLPNFKFGNNARKFCMTYYNGGIYIGGYFDQVKGITNSSRIFYWDGAKYKGIGSTIGADSAWKTNGINAMVVYKGNLVITGAKLAGVSSTLATSQIGSWNGSKWSILGFYGTFGGTVNNLFVSDTSLYAIGSFYQADILYPVHNIARYANKMWNKVMSPSGAAQLDAGVSYGGEITVTGKDSSGISYSAYKYNTPGKKWSKLGSSLSLPVGNLLVYNSKLWASGAAARYFDASGWHTFTKNPLLHNARFTSTKSNLYLSGDFNQINTGLTIQANDAVEILDSMAEVRGIVYEDSNHNCSYDAGEKLLKNWNVQIRDSSGALLYSANTDTNGVYDIFISPTSSNSLRLVNKSFWNMSCNSQSVQCTTSVNSIMQHDFALIVKAGIKDLHISLNGNGNARIGDTAHYTLHCENSGSVDMNSNDTFWVTLNYDKRLSNFKTNNSNSIGGTNPIRVYFTGLSAGKFSDFKFALHLDTGLSISDTLMLSAIGYLSPKADTILANNNDTLYQHPVKSYDPNGKSVSPDGLIKQNTAKLNYSVFFQNTGKAAAYKVVVIDSVDTNLPLTKVVINSASHKYSISVKNNVLMWTFDNINLPDSAADEKNSHGNLIFSASLTPGLAVGTEIKNKAYIYFDYNAPVTTNETLNKIGIITAVESLTYISENIKVYPNPAGSELIIENKGEKNQKFILMNSIGQTLETIRLGSLESYKLNTSNYAPGLYLFRSENGETAKVMIK